MRNPAAYNALGAQYVDLILNDSSTTFRKRLIPVYGEVHEYRLPSGHGVRYRASGEFMGFLDP